MNRYLADFASLLQIKPILTMYNGKPGTEKVRTRDRAVKRVLEMLDSFGRLEKIAIVHTHATMDRLMEFKKIAAAHLPKVDIMVEDITPVIGAHIGPGAIGFAIVKAV
jgi:fatty acid-binding protein DegV